MLKILTLASLFALLLQLNSLRVNLYQENYRGPSPLWYEDEMIEHSKYIVQTYFDLKGIELVPLSLFDRDPEAAAKELFYMPDRVVLSHGIQCDDDGPILNYGNSAALRLWKGTWEQLTSLPSKYTADADVRRNREEDMKKVTKYGYLDNYDGVRIAFDKTKFRISNVTIWNMNIDNNRRIGQAATFSRWEYL
jgi:hypothetical protein